MKNLILILSSFLLISFSTLAQFDAPCGPFDENCNDTPQEEQIPVDGGIGLLFAAGAAWGIKKLKEEKK